MVQLVHRTQTRDRDFGAGGARFTAHGDLGGADLLASFPRIASRLAPFSPPAPTLHGLTTVEITALKSEELTVLSSPMPAFSDAEALRAYYGARAPFVLPPSARPELFTKEKIDGTSARVKQLCEENGIPYINYKLHLCFVDVRQPDGTSLQVPSHLLSTFEYKGKNYGGPFLGSVLGNTLQTRGAHLDEGYRTRIVKESLDLTIRHFGLELLTIAIPQPSNLTAQMDPSFEQRAEWLKNSRATEILARTCGGTSYQYFLDLSNAPFAKEIAQSPNNQIFFTMDASLRPLDAARAEIRDRDFLRAMLAVDTARSSRSGKQQSNFANRGAQDKDSWALQDLFIRAFFSLGERNVLQAVGAR